MANLRLVAIGASVIAALLTGGAIYSIVDSTGSIDDVGAYATPRPTPGDAVEFTAQQGEGPQQIGDRLEQTRVIDSSTQFRVLVSLVGYDKLLQAGDYEFQPGTPALEVIYRMREGIFSTHAVTVIEGWRAEQIADAVAEQGVPREVFLEAVKAHDYDYSFVDELPRGQDLEGFLFPATYGIRSRDTAHDLVNRMLAGFNDNTPSGVTDAAQAVGLSLPQVVTLASIIEREAQKPEERPIMAQVLLSRLRQGIPLEADPTVQYALVPFGAKEPPGGYWKPELTRADLEIDSPYNTYRNRGLPPGPVCNPGAGSIVAVIHPADTNYLYFVAKPDGSHAFASTLEEHLANIDKYQGATPTASASPTP